MINNLIMLAKGMYYFPQILKSLSELYYKLLFSLEFPFEALLQIQTYLHSHWVEVYLPTMGGKLHQDKK